jgi:hypothetical protein
LKKLFYKKKKNWFLFPLTTTETDTAVTTTTTSPTTTTIATNMVETYYSRNVFTHFFVKLDTVDQTPFLHVFTVFDTGLCWLEKTQFFEIKVLFHLSSSACAVLFFHR